jgi:glyceraldehyde 3-phosphate dehydrogenase
VKAGINASAHGRQLRRSATALAMAQVVAINDLFPTETNAHLLKTTLTTAGLTARSRLTTGPRGRWQADHRVAERDRLPSLASAGVELVIESTDFSRRDGAAKTGALVKKVIIPPGQERDKTIVPGVNDHEYDPKKHHVISYRFCTTNGLAPVVKVLLDTFGILKADDHRPRLYEHPARPRRRPQRHP